MLGGSRVDHSCCLLTSPFPEQTNKSFLVNTQVTNVPLDQITREPTGEIASLIGPTEFTEER